MGFKKQSKNFKLVFTDEEYEGFEVVMKSLSIGEYLALTTVGAAVTPGSMKDMFTALSQSMVSWNLEDETGAPIPHTIEEIMKQDLDFINTILVSWMTGMAGVDPKLPKTSSLSEIQDSIPMETL